MKLPTATGQAFDFSYCMNVHPGESWEAVQHQLLNAVLPIRSALSADEPFGLGMRIANDASIALEAEAERARLRELLESTHTYAFTLNGFPFGAFHQTRVKEQVHAPDWRNPARAEYTCRLISLLGEVLPEGQDGSISTSPLSFKLWNISDAEQESMLRHLMQVVAHAAAVEERTGRLAHIGIEPEPFGWLETTDETVSYFEEVVFRQGSVILQGLAGVDALQAGGWIRRHLGVCVDTCHVALQYENPAQVLERYAAAGIRVSKVQLSAALELRDREDIAQILEPFRDGVYLHQVMALRGEGTVERWVDVEDFLLQHRPSHDPLRVHVHVPLHWAGDDTLRSTRYTMDDAFWKTLQQSECRHLEVETYTFDVLPEAVKGQVSISENIVNECTWALEKLRG